MKNKNAIEKSIKAMYNMKYYMVKKW